MDYIPYMLHGWVSYYWVDNMFIICLFIIQFYTPVVPLCTVGCSYLCVGSHNADEHHNTSHGGEQPGHCIQRVDRWRAGGETAHHWTLLWPTENQDLGGCGVAAVSATVNPVPPAAQLNTMINPIILFCMSFCVCVNCIFVIYLPTCICVCVYRNKCISWYVYIQMWCLTMLTYMYVNAFCYVAISWNCIIASIWWMASSFTSCMMTYAHMHANRSVTFVIAYMLIYCCTITVCSLW